MFGRILDIIWPRLCDICGNEVDRSGRYVCSECMNRLVFCATNGCCRRCGRAAEKLDGEFLCEDCRERKPSFDRVGSALVFDADSRRMINDFKFKGHFWMVPDFVDWMEAYARTRFKVEEIDVVVAMPSTIWHRFDRGYSQCAILAKGLAKRLGRPYASFVLRRKGSPQRQRGLSEEERRINVIGTFSVMRPGCVAGRKVLLVDDIMTTGSTLSECAAELKRAGASSVWCQTLARTLR